MRLTGRVEAGTSRTIAVLLNLGGAAAARKGEPLPPEYHRLYRLWFVSGFPAFAAVLAIFWLMIARPPLG